VLTAEGSLMSDPRLLAHERWLAGLVTRRHAQRRTPAVLRTEARFGTLGVNLLAAALADVLLGQVLVLFGLVLLVILGTDSALAEIGVGLGLVVIVVSWLRVRQGLAEGRMFRGTA
jgi:hypothetical protein